ncbi:hypothetical protein [Runella sp.]|uniref:hypothetical protein n=1 Tax=Runella sp. TaxID=1960881 RepID=UPI00261C0E02|nr:hypothetical protein [Runella sp.]
MKKALFLLTVLMTGGVGIFNPLNNEAYAETYYPSTAGLIGDSGTNWQSRYIMCQKSSGGWEFTISGVLISGTIVGPQTTTNGSQRTCTKGSGYCLWSGDCE